MRQSSAPQTLGLCAFRVYSLLTPCIAKGSEPLVVATPVMGSQTPGTCLFPRYVSTLMNTITMKFMDIVVINFQPPCGLNLRKV